MLAFAQIETYEAFRYVKWVENMKSDRQRALAYAGAVEVSIHVAFSHFE